MKIEHTVMEAAAGVDEFFFGLRSGQIERGFFGRRFERGLR